MNPETGTFTSMDTYAGTLDNPVSLHEYLYANANPVMTMYDVAQQVRRIYSGLFSKLPKE